MPRAIFCTAAAVAALLFAVSNAAAQLPSGDSVTGDLFDEFETGTTVFNVDAHSGPAGEDPSGSLSWHVGGGLGPTWNVGVTCLAVDGATAVIGYSGTLFFAGVLQPVAGLARAVDGGGPGSGLDSFEWAEVEGSEGGAPIPGPTDCSSYPDGFPQGAPTAFNRAGGDLVITDARPALTSKEQCKHGGWRTYGFKNQGQCVRAVPTRSAHTRAAARVAPAP